MTMFTPYQEWQICGVQGVAFLQLLLVVFLYKHPGRVRIFHVPRATLSAVI